MHNFLKNRIFLIALIVIILFIFLNFVIPAKYLLNPTRNLVFHIFTPITRIFYHGGDRAGGFFSKLSEIRNLSDEKAELEKKNIELEMENSKLKGVLHENELLREELGLKKELVNNQIVAADIIGRGPTGANSRLIINKGAKDGLKEGMPVVSGTMLLGKLGEVDESFSRIILIIDESSVVNVLVEESRAAGLAKGEVGFNLKLDSVSQESPLKVGQRIVTSGLGGTMPKNLVVGEVSEIISPESEIFQSARIKPAAGLNHLEIVFIIKT